MRSKSAVPNVAHLDVDQHVLVGERLQLQLLVGLDPDVRAAAHQLHGRLQLGRIRGRLDQVDDDDHVGAEVACHVHRDVAHHAAVGKDLLAHDDRRERTRDGHAGPHRRGDVALVQHDHPSADHVGGDGAVRNRQLVEVALHARAGHVGAQQVFDAAGVHEAAGHDDAALADAELELVAVGDALALLLDRLEVAAALSADDGLPVDADQELLQFVGRNAGGVPRADQRAHAGAGDAVDRHVHLLEHLQHADVGAALGAAAGQHEADAWAGRVGTRGSRACLSGGRRSCATQGDQCKKCCRQDPVGRRSEAHVDLHFNRSALVVDGILTIPPNADGLTCSVRGAHPMAGLVPEWIVCGVRGRDRVRGDVQRRPGHESAGLRASLGASCAHAQVALRRAGCGSRHCSGDGKGTCSCRVRRRSA